MGFPLPIFEAMVELQVVEVCVVQQVVHAKWDTDISEGLVCSKPARLGVEHEGPPAQEWHQVAAQQFECTLSVFAWPKHVLEAVRHSPIARATTKQQCSMTYGFCIKAEEALQDELLEVHRILGQVARRDEHELLPEHSAHAATKVGHRTTTSK